MKLAIDTAKLADQTLDYISDVDIDNVGEVNVIESVQTEESGLEIEAEDAIEVNRRLLWNINSNFL